MKKYLLTTLLLLALTMTMIACGESENATTNDNADVENTAEITDNTTEIADNSDAQLKNEETTSTDTTTDSIDTTATTPSVTYEGIDFNSTLPGKEWIQTTFPGVINEPKIVIFNDETNKKQIVEYGEMILFDEADTFALYSPEGWTLIRGSYLTPNMLEAKYYYEETFDIEILKEEYLFWKDVDGGAQYKVTFANWEKEQEQELMCMISLGY